MIRQYELVEQVKAYDPSADEEALNRAYVFSMKAHGTQVRASGDPYFSHPVEVAGILAGMKLDSASIVTGLLHDTVEDTVATLDEIEDLFGPEIGKLVDGVTKLSRIELQSDDARQAENFRKLLVAMSQDIRVLLVKLADRLHNMRTLKFVPDPDKRRRIAHETMEIYAPLAERIGMQRMKDELEDLAFAEINPEAHGSVRARMDFLKAQGGDLVERIVAELRATLADAGAGGEVQGREKRPYSIWRKMERKNISFEQISDVVAFRIIMDSIPRCYAALGVVHGAYAMVPGRFKDYISTPKPNGYQSIHSVVYGPEQQRIEVQIRSRNMHDYAELGVAAHWIYKSGSTNDPREGKQYRWVRELLEILEHASGPEEFLEHTKLEMFQDQVFCFTPKGDLIALPRGATPVDFAYAVHSQVGDTCVGAKINGKLKPLRTQLANGDQVEVICSKSHTPSPSWESFVVTGRARSRIRRFVRSQQRQQYAELGRSIFERAMHQYGLPTDVAGLANARTVLKFKTNEDLYEALGGGNLTGSAVVEAINPAAALKPAAQKVVPLARRRGAEPASAHAVPIKGLIPGMAVHFAACCHPLPGERIVGIVTTGKGVTIHTIDCETLHTFEETPERWIDVSWNLDSAKPDVHIGRINVLVANQPGTLGNMSTLIGKHLCNISNLKITNRSADFFEILVDVEVRDVRHLTSIIAALRADPSINAVERARG
ncbi:MAG: bifunctional (p)ppGpp synthetase/guanosine-3',5'-bis(diphosphate) 3'-pyrophosphohydrolase [Alphaproteobacteria bacterium]|nr:bifunctional (p)ppGpp synthetase/guanosine-3',5'-bis(diphosphate) 3'-pyrophosphohydrolase [Alphaproteobacteria bacterium]